MSKNLVLMDAGMFCEGMAVKAKIYYLYNDNYVLLCKDVVFTRDLIDKLYRIAADHGGVYIEESSYEEVWNESLRRYSMTSTSYEEAYRQVRHDYNKVLSKTALLIGEVASTSIIPIKLTEEIQNTIAEDLKNLDQSLVLRCINMISEADDYLYTHSLNVAALNGLIGQWMKMSDDRIKLLIKIGLLHDLGKLKVTHKILYKPARLSAEEFEAIKLHPALSYDILRNSGEEDWDILLGVRQHHEKPNGTGYPDGLTQDDISLYARITSVSDIYDAMVSKRCYKEASSPFDILAQFKVNQFSELDLKIVNTFLENVTYLFVGMKIKLSNGDCGEIIFVPPNDLSKPLIRIGNHVFSTSASGPSICLEQNI